VVRCINGCFVWLPLVAPQSEFPGEADNAVGILSFIGSTIFEVGSVLMVVEAINAESECTSSTDRALSGGEAGDERPGERWCEVKEFFRSGKADIGCVVAGSDCFGWALEESLEDHGLRLRPRHEGCHHHHRSRRALLKDSAVAAMAMTAAKNVAEPGGLEERKREDGNVRSEEERRWYVPAGIPLSPIPRVYGQTPWLSEYNTRLTRALRLWWPSWHEFRTHYIKEIGFLASFLQLIGATIFWISGVTALPPIYNALSVPVMNGVYWAPQVVGGTGFIVSGLLFMTEVQEKW
jgi:hypothetical protein